LNKVRPVAVIRFGEEMKAREGVPKIGERECWEIGGKMWSDSCSGGEKGDRGRLRLWRRSWKARFLLRQREWIWALRSTRSRKNEECFVLENLRVDCGELGRKGRGGRGRKRNLKGMPAETIWRSWHWRNGLIPWSWVQNS